MGIRAKVLVVMVVLLTLVGTAGTTLLHLKLNASIQEQEVDNAAQDMRLLLAVLNTQLAQIDGVLQSWSNWTELYEHVASPGVRFRAEELSPVAVAVAQVDWLAILDSQGNAVDEVSAPFDQATALKLSPAMAETPADTVRRFAASVARSPRACGVVQLEQYLAFACHRPLLNSEGRGEPRGTVVIGRRITAELLHQIADQSKMQFRIVPRSGVVAADPAPVAAAAQPWARVVPTVAGKTAGHLLLSVPLNDIVQRPLADLQLEWPRVALAGAQRALVQTVWLLLIMIAGTGVGAILAVDMLVVRRLRSVRDQLGQVVATGQWDGQVRMSGQDEIAGLATFINRIIGVVRDQVAELGALATTDALTALGNRRCFDERITNLVDRHRRTGRTSALVLVDVDHFKRFNDQYGHPAGDRALRVVADTLRGHARRPGDMAMRLGGEEFALLLEEVTLEAAVGIANALCEALRRAAVPHQNTEAGVLTVSCGVAEVRSGDTPHLFYQRADEALYRAKQAGRDRVEAQRCESPAFAVVPAPPVP